MQINLPVMMSEALPAELFVRIARQCNFQYRADHTAVTRVVPFILKAVSEHIALSGRTAELAAQLHGMAPDTIPVLLSALGSAHHDDVIDAGIMLLTDCIGDGAAAELVADVSRMLAIKSGSAADLIAMLVPAVFFGLAELKRAQGLDAYGLGHMLVVQATNIEASIALAERTTAKTAALARTRSTWAAASSNNNAAAPAAASRTTWRRDTTAASLAAAEAAMASTGRRAPAWRQSVITDRVLTTASALLLSSGLFLLMTYSSPEVKAPGEAPKVRAEAAAPAEPAMAPKGTKVSPSQTAVVAPVVSPALTQPPSLEPRTIADATPKPTAPAEPARQAAAADADTRAQTDRKLIVFADMGVATTIDKETATNPIQTGAVPARPAEAETVATVASARSKPVDEKTPDSLPAAKSDATGKAKRDASQVATQRTPAGSSATSQTGAEGNTGASENLEKRRLADVKTCRAAAQSAIQAGMLRFEYQADAVAPDDNPGFKKLASAIKGCPLAKVRIEGHTDGDGATERNTALSKRRAKSLYDYFLSAGISPERVTYLGMGTNKPVALNDTEENKQKNRRVDLIIE